MRRTASAILCILLVGVLQGMVHAVDTLELSDGTIARGRFDAYRNRRFLFQPLRGDVLHVRLSRVSSLDLEPPALVSVKTRGNRPIDEAVLKAYGPEGFDLQVGGDPLTVDGERVTWIKPGLDFRRGGMLEAARAAAHSSPAREGSAPLLAVTGVISIIHFHKPDITSSVRQGNYVRSIADRNSGDIVLRRVDIDDWSAPEVSRYRLTSLPQFWFYNREAKRVCVLKDRFTGDDIDRAVKAAGR